MRNIKLARILKLFLGVMILFVFAVLPVNAVRLSVESDEFIGDKENTAVNVQSVGQKADEVCFEEKEPEASSQSDMPLTTATGGTLATLAALLVASMNNGSSKKDEAYIQNPSLLPEPQIDDTLPPYESIRAKDPANRTRAEKVMGIYDLELESSGFSTMGLSRYKLILKPKGENTVTGAIVVKSITGENKGNFSGTIIGNKLIGYYSYKDILGGHISGTLEINYDVDLKNDSGDNIQNVSGQINEAGKSAKFIASRHDY